MVIILGLKHKDTTWHPRNARVLAVSIQYLILFNFIIDIFISENNGNFPFLSFDCSSLWFYVISVLVVTQKAPKQPFSLVFLWLSMKGIILRNTQLFAYPVNILRILHLFLKLFSYFCKCIYLFIYSMAKKDVYRLKIMLAVTKHSNKWLAEMLGKDQATISKWCTNTCQPDLETLIRISDLLKVDVNDLLNKECIKEWWTIYWNR